MAARSDEVVHITPENAEGASIVEHQPVASQAREDMLRRQPHQMVFSSSMGTATTVHQAARSPPEETLLIQRREECCLLVDETRLFVLVLRRLGRRQTQDGPQSPQRRDGSVHVRRGRATSTVVAECDAGMYDISTMPVHPAGAHKS